VIISATKESITMLPDANNTIPISAVLSDNLNDIYNSTTKKKMSIEDSPVLLMNVQGCFTSQLNLLKRFQQAADRKNFDFVHQLVIYSPDTAYSEKTRYHSLMLAKLSGIDLAKFHFTSNELIDSDFGSNVASVVYAEGSAISATNLLSINSTSSLLN
jgi:hypothetical protein